MSCSPCGTPIINGQPGGGSGGGSSGSILFTVGDDINAATVFPVLSTLVSATIPPNRLANTGDMMRAHFAGTVINAGAGGSTFAPFFGIDASFWWGTVSVNIPNGSILLPWSCDIDITRKSAVTFRGAGTFMMDDFNSALTGVGSLALPNQGGPIASPAAANACNWAIAQQFIFNTSSAIPGMTWTVTTGSIEVKRRP